MEYVFCCPLPHTPTPENYQTNLLLDYYDRSHEDKSLPFFGGDDTIREILGTTPHLKASKDEIRAFFEATADENARISYIKRIFNNDYTEVILRDGRRVGYKTYQNVLQLWEGSFLSRTAQSFYDWGVIAQHFEAMRLLGELQDTMKPLPSIDGQLSLMTAEAEERKPSAFTFSQEIIDAVLTRGSGISEGKMRIYEQFQKSLSAKENADFLKNEYGWGGAYPVIVGAGIDEQHDGTMTKKKQVGVRFDSNRTRLKTGETQRPNGTYAYRWSTPDGKRHSIYAPTLEKLREQEEQIIVDKHDGIRSDVKSITVNEMFDLWCQLKRGIKDSTFKNYIYMYELFVKPSFGKNRLVQVKKSDVRKFYNSLADGKVLKIATIDNVHNVLHQVFQVAVDDGMIRQNPTDNMLKELKLSHGFEREKKEALTVAQQKLFFDYMLSHPKDTHWYPVFYVMANTGMRVGEITGLRWSDIDLKKGIIRVNHTLVYYNHRDEKGCYFSINTPKTKAGEREIPMTEGVKQAFLMEREFQSQAEISSKSRVDGYDDFIFVNRYGDVQNQGNLNKALRRMMRDCNDEILEKYGADSDPVLLPQFSCHILRHTFATRLCESGANLKFIQSILGHADVSTTMNIYVDVTDALKKKEITAFDDYMTTKLET